MLPVGSRAARGRLAKLRWSLKGLEKRKLALASSLVDAINVCDLREPLVGSLLLTNARRGAEFGASHGDGKRTIRNLIRGVEVGVW